MGHAFDYFTTDKRESIIRIAREYSECNCDRGANPSGTYHGNMVIHDTIICDSYEDAIETINKLDNGFYDDHAVRYKDKDMLKPTKSMEVLKERMQKNRIAKNEYEEEHSVWNRKADFIGCPHCKSRLSRRHCKNKFRQVCPVCGKELRPQYVINRMKKFDDDYEILNNKYKELVRNRKEKCPVRWCFKVEVHC